MMAMAVISSSKVFFSSLMLRMSPRRSLILSLQGFGVRELCVENLSIRRTKRFLPLPSYRSRSRSQASLACGVHDSLQGVVLDREFDLGRSLFVLELPVV